MLPPHIAQELMRRMPPKHARSLARNHGLKPDQPLPALEPQFFAERALTGSLDFDLTVTTLGQCQSIPCRLSFTADLEDDIDDLTGELIRVLGDMQQRLHALCATGEDGHVFEWRPLERRLVPAAALVALDEQVEELARSLEAASATIECET